MKLSAVRDVIKGNRMVVCEDSIVRGTQLKNYTIRKLWDNGAKEIHIRPACPPLMFPCRYASSTRTVAELAAHRAIRALEGGKGNVFGGVSGSYDRRNTPTWSNGSAVIWM